MGNGGIKMPKKQQAPPTNFPAPRIGNKAFSVFDEVIDCDDDITPYTSMNERTDNNKCNNHMLICKSMSESDVTISIRASLKKMFLFKSFDQSCVEQIADRFVPYCCAVDEIIIKEGDIGENM